MFNSNMPPTNHEKMVKKIRTEKPPNSKFHPDRARKRGRQQTGEVRWAHGVTLRCTGTVRKCKICSIRPSHLLPDDSTTLTRPSLTSLFEWEAVTLGDVAAYERDGRQCPKYSIVNDPWPGARETPHSFMYFEQPNPAPDHGAPPPPRTYPCLDKMKL